MGVLCQRRYFIQMQNGGVGGSGLCYSYTNPGNASILTGFVTATLPLIYSVFEINKLEEGGICMPGDRPDKGTEGCRP